MPMRAAPLQADARILVGGRQAGAAFGPGERASIGESMRRGSLALRCVSARLALWAPLTTAHVLRRDREGMAACTADIEDVARPPSERTNRLQRPALDSDIGLNHPADRIEGVGAFDLNLHMQLHFTN